MNSILNLMLETYIAHCQFNNNGLWCRRFSRMNVFMDIVDITCLFFNCHSILRLIWCRLMIMDASAHTKKSVATRRKKY